MLRRGWGYCICAIADQASQACMLLCPVDTARKDSNGTRVGALINNNSVRRCRCRRTTSWRWTSGQSQTTPCELTLTHGGLFPYKLACTPQKAKRARRSKSAAGARTRDGHTQGWTVDPGERIQKPRRRRSAPHGTHDHVATEN